MIRTLTLIVFGTLLVAAIITPPVYSALNHIFDDFPWKFSRLYGRIAMLVLVVMIYVLRREFSFSELRGYYRRDRLRREWQPLVAGVLLTLLVTLFVLPFMVLDGRLSWVDRDVSQYAVRLAEVALAALFIAVLEESFFRALIFRRVRASVSVPSAVVICSLVYAFAHFIKPAQHWQYPGFSATVGFEYLYAVFERLLLPGALPAFFGLFLVGAVLCVVVWRTQSLLLCVGLHAGWIMAMKLTRFSTEKTSSFVHLDGVGRNFFLLAEPLAWVAILLVGGIVLWAFTRIWPDALRATAAHRPHEYQVGSG